MVFVYRVCHSNVYAMHRIGFKRTDMLQYTTIAEQPKIFCSVHFTIECITADVPQQFQGATLFMYFVASWSCVAMR